MSVRILLADDDPHILASLREYLEISGFAVDAAPDGTQARERFGPGRYALAILDLSMPGYTGLELLSHFKAIDPDTEVVILTGQAGLQSALTALRLGAYDYLLKPLARLGDLRAVIDRALEKQRLSQANRSLINELQSAQEKLAAQRRRELELIRQIGQGLASALDLERISRLVCDLLWDNIPVHLLSLQMRPWGDLPPQNLLRSHPDVPPAAQDHFLAWLQDFATVCRRQPSDLRCAAGLQDFPGEAVFAPDPPPPLLRQVLVAPLIIDQDLIGLLAGARETPFTFEDKDIFQIILLQATAALKNLALFEQMKFLANRDPLTGLFNQRYFWRVLQDELLRAHRYHLPLSLLFLDLDHFKAINDTHGHAVGDEVLQQVSRLVESSIRQSDVLCRYGGEEFALILPQTPQPQAMALAQRLRRQLADAPLALKHHNLPVTMSIGVSSLKKRMSAEEMLQAADAALYQAKEAGRNRVMAA